MLHYSCQCVCKFQKERDLSCRTFKISHRKCTQKKYIITNTFLNYNDISAMSARLSQLNSATPHRFSSAMNFSHSKHSRSKTKCDVPLHKVINPAFAGVSKTPEFKSYISKISSFRSSVQLWVLRPMTSRGCGLREGGLENGKLEKII